MAIADQVALLNIAGMLRQGKELSEGTAGNEHIFMGILHYFEGTPELVVKLLKGLSMHGILFSISLLLHPLLDNVHKTWGWGRERRNVVVFQI